VPEIVRDGESGFLVENDDLDTQVAAIARLLRDSNLRARIGTQARAFIEENHSVQRLPVHLSGLYEAARPTQRSAARTGLPKKSIKHDQVYEH
jgi:glycosyltransferase involved in cell wall biosynthesis